MYKCIAVQTGDWCLFAFFKHLTMLHDVFSAIIDVCDCLRRHTSEIMEMLSVLYSTYTLSWTNMEKHLLRDFKCSNR